MADSDLKPLQCPNCKRVYSLKTKANFETHMKSCGKGQYKCDVCNKGYSSIHSLRNHLKLHVGGASYKCEICGRVFTQKFSLTLHATIHKDKSERENERLNCEYCNKTFAWRSSLSRHMQNHFDGEDKSYSCDSCGERFSSYSKFYNHKSCSSIRKMSTMKESIKDCAEKVSLNLNLHRCQLCNQGFKDRENLDEHVISCDPFSLSNQGKIALSKDEKDAIEKVVSEKMSRCVSVHENSGKKRKMITHVKTLYKSKIQDAVTQPEHTENYPEDTDKKMDNKYDGNKNTERSMGDSFEDIEIEQIDSDEKVNKTREKTDISIHHSEMVDDNEERREKATERKVNVSENSTIGSLQLKVVIAKGTNTQTEIIRTRRAQNYTGKQDQRILNKNIRKRKSEATDNESKLNNLCLDKKLAIEKEVVLPTRRTQRIRKPKQFHGFDVDFVQLNVKTEKKNKYEGASLEMEANVVSEDKNDYDKNQDSKESRTANKSANQVKRNKAEVKKNKEVEIYDNSKYDINQAKRSESKEKKENDMNDYESQMYSEKSAEEETEQSDETASPANQDVHTTSPLRQKRGLRSKPQRSVKKRKSLRKQAREKVPEDLSRGFKELREKKLIITYKCTSKNCYKTFCTMKEIASHKKLVHKELFRNLCTKCDKEFGTYGIYRSHIRMEHSDEDSLTFALRKTDIIVKDKNNGIDGELLVCTKCGYRYGNKEDSNHQCQPEELRYFCPCCSHVSKQADEISLHISSNHQGEYHEIKNKDKYLHLRSAAKEPGWRVGDTATVCDLCQSQHATNKDLKQHMNQKHAVFPFACGLCWTCYGRKNPLQRHLLTHKKSFLVCNVCQKEFYEKARLEAHRLTHTGERPFQCEVCGNRYCDEKGVKKHMMLKHIDHFRATYPDSMLGRDYHSTLSDKDLTPVMCHLCGKTFSLDKHLNKHMKTHNKSHMYQHPHYGQSFHKNAAFRAHKLKHMTFNFPEHQKAGVMPDSVQNRSIISKNNFNNLKLFDVEEGHPSGLPYCCGACMKRFRGVKGVNLHIQTMHVKEKDKRHVCTICKRGFAMPSGLRTHMRLHTNSKPYRCRICNKHYRQLSHIRQHLLYHGKALLECKICRRPFKTKPNLRGHVKTHCTIFPFKCVVRGCTSAFQSVYPFSAHLSTCLDTVDHNTMLKCNFCPQSFTKDEIISHHYNHENEAKFPCDVCGVSFKDFPNLYCHKESSGHFLESELKSACTNSDYTINQLTIKECDNDWSTKTLMSQYEFMEPEHDDGNYNSNVYIEGGKPDSAEPDLDDNDGELILIAEQLTHMASGVPFREVIVQASENRDDNETEIAIDSLDEQVQNISEISNVNVQQPETNIEVTSDDIGPIPQISGPTGESFQYIIETSEMVSDIADSYIVNPESEGIRHVMQKEIPEDQKDGNSEMSLQEPEQVDQLNLGTGPLNRESGVEELVDICEINEQLTTNNLSDPVKFVDQTGNEIIVYVLNDLGEQIRLTDSEEILNTVVQSGDYSIMQKTDDIPNLVDTASVNIIEMNSVEVYDSNPKSSVDALERYDAKSSNKTIQKKRVKTLHQPKSQIQNTDKIKGLFNKELDDTHETNMKENISYRASMNFYEEKSEKYSFECSTCKKRFPSRKTLNHHSKTHIPNNQRRFQCEMCGSGFHTQDKYDIHMRIHTKERPYKCEECDRTFTQIGGLKIHLRIHKGYFPFECTQCDRKFTTNGQLNKHINSHHPGSDKEDFLIQCKTCELFYKDKFDLRIHQLLHLSDGVAQKFLSTCNSEDGQEVDTGVFDLVKGVHNPLKRQGTLKSFICEMCGAILKGEKSLTAHRLLHELNTSSFQCKVCEEIFPDQLGLDTHMANHTEDGVVCKLCGVFVRNPMLTRHMQRHKEFNCLNYQCRKCGKQYKLEHSFMRHVVQCRFEELNKMITQGSEINMGTD